MGRPKKIVEEVKGDNEPETIITPKEVKVVKPLPKKEVVKVAPVKLFKDQVVVELVSKVSFPIQIAYGDETLFFSPYMRIKNVIVSKLPTDLPKTIIKI